MKDRPIETFYFGIQSVEAYKDMLLNEASNLQHTQTSQTTDEDLQPEFTDEERSYALHTIIQQMIHLYGYQATRTAFFATLCNHAFSSNTNHSSPNARKLNRAMVKIKDLTPSFMNFFL